jgi:uncharacterized protein
MRLSDPDTERSDRAEELCLCVMHTAVSAGCWGGKPTIYLGPIITCIPVRTAPSASSNLQPRAAAARTSFTPMHVSGLFIYPVKSLRGYAVQSATADGLGFVGDRRFLIVDPLGRLLTQRTLPAMATVTASLSEAFLSLSAANVPDIKVPLRVAAGSAPIRLVSVWKSEGLRAEDCGDEVATWLSDVLHAECRLVRIGAEFHRPVLKAAAKPGDLVTFADAVPFLIHSEASLEDLNDRLVAQQEEPVSMDRFRPNIVVTGCAAYAEDSWPRICIGQMVLRPAGPCARCVVTTTDQLTGVRGKEPLRTLSLYRRDAKEPTAVNYGQNYIHETKSGTIRVGDVVEVVAG